MIDQSVRNRLKDQIRKGDYEAAAQIYKKNVTRYVTARYLQKYLEGQKNPTGRPGCHDPAAMFAAIAEAVRQRKAREQQATTQANELIQQIIRDTTPPQPIAL